MTDRGDGTPARENDGLRSAADPELDWEIVTVGGVDGQRLARVQTRAMKEVLEWLAQKRSERGENPAA